MFATGIGFLDRILGGGFIPGETVALVGPPGSGKTTLLYSIALALTESGRSLVFAACEESPTRLAQLPCRIVGAPTGEGVAMPVRFEEVGSEVEMLDLLRRDPAEVVILDALHSLRSLGTLNSVVKRLMEAKRASATLLLGGHTAGRTHRRNDYTVPAVDRVFRLEMLDPAADPHYAHAGEGARTRHILSCFDEEIFDITPRLK